jgi:hypothetical protein
MPKNKWNPQEETRNVRMHVSTGHNLRALVNGLIVKQQGGERISGCRVMDELIREKAEREHIKLPC